MGTGKSGLRENDSHNNVMMCKDRPALSEYQSRLGYIACVFHLSPMFWLRVLYLTNGKSFISMSASLPQMSSRKSSRIDFKVLS